MKKKKCDVVYLCNGKCDKCKLSELYDIIGRITLSEEELKTMMINWELPTKDTLINNLKDIRGN